MSSWQSGDQVCLAGDVASMIHVGYQRFLTLMNRICRVSGSARSVILQVEATADHTRAYLLCGSEFLLQRLCVSSHVNFNIHS